VECIDGHGRLEDRCCASAMYTSIAPKYFEMYSGGRLLVLRETVDDGDLDTIEETVTR
jgi:hypothetical protein